MPPFLPTWKPLWWTPTWRWRRRSERRRLSRIPRNRSIELTHVKKTTAETTDDGPAIRYQAFNRRGLLVAAERSFATDEALWRWVERNTSTITILAYSAGRTACISH